MDSLTQIALGAAVGEAVLGRRIGNRAMLAGAALGTLPDLDVLVPFADDVANFTYHRSFSHSFVMLTLITPLISKLIHRWLHQNQIGQNQICQNQISKSNFGHTLALVFLVLNTHVLLDCFTVYGTQAFWPLWNRPIGWSTIFIIDPVYTMPLLVGLALTFKQSRKFHRRALANAAGLLLSSCYLTWTIVAQSYAENKAVEALEQQGLSDPIMLTTPSPFSLLWRFVIRDEDSYYEGYYSLLDEHANISFSEYDSHESYYETLKSHWPVRRLGWFTGGFYAMREENAEIVMTDLRMGIESAYVFNFKVASTVGNKITPVRAEQLPLRVDSARIVKVFQRMIDQNVSLLP